MCACVSTAILRSCNRPVLKWEESSHSCYKFKLFFLLHESPQLWERRRHDYRRREKIIFYTTVIWHSLSGFIQIHCFKLPWVVWVITRLRNDEEVVVECFIDIHKSQNMCVHSHHPRCILQVLSSSPDYASLCPHQQCISCSVTCGFTSQRSIDVLLFLKDQT